MKIDNLKQFEKFLKSRIPSREALFVGDLGLKRAKYLMRLLGNPQNKIRVIHVAGTSGKGSTVHLLSHLLQSQGFSVGMSISPHMFDIRERFQINNKLTDEKIVLKYFNQILPKILQMEKCKFGMPTFFEINIALAYYIFAQEKLDYAVMETGLGGTLDATNTVSSKNKICIITKIGLDHTEILGNTLTKIADQKAGIIQKNNIVISTQQAASVRAAVSKKCQQKNARLYFVNKKNYSIISSTPRETIFNFNYSCHPELVSGSKKASSAPIEIPKRVRKDNTLSLKNIHLGLIGVHQAENCSAALCCLVIASERDDFNINEKALRQSLENISIAGRCEIKKIARQTVIIDGAHNPQKMKSFAENLSAIFPQQKFSFILAFKKGKDFQKMLNQIIPLADKILLTHFSTKNMDNHWSSIDNEEIATFLKSQKFKNFEIINNKHSDILQNVRMSKKPVVITGSLYLVGKIYPYLKK